MRTMVLVYKNLQKWVIAFLGQMLINLPATWFASLGFSQVYGLGDGTLGPWDLVDPHCLTELFATNPGAGPGAPAGFMVEIC